MTLAVARATPQQIIIVSDTRTSEPRQNREVGRLTDGLLKTTFLSEQVAIAFTGSTEIAQDAVREFLKTKGRGHLDLSCVLDFFKESTADNENEYLIGFAGPIRLFRIANGQFEERKAAFVGDKAAFERFQSGPDRTVKPTKDFWRATIVGPDVVEPDLILDLIHRIQLAIEDSRLATVGDFFTVAVSNGGQFRFVGVATLYFDNEARILGPTGVPILSSTGENRAYIFTKWTPLSESLASAAFVFSEVQRAYVFHSQGLGFSDVCTVFDGLVGDALADEIERKLGIKFAVAEMRYR
jgi:hypothetical protein